MVKSLIFLGLIYADFLKGQPIHSLFLNNEQTSLFDFPSFLYFFSFALRSLFLHIVNKKQENKRKNSVLESNYWYNYHLILGFSCRFLWRKLGIKIAILYSFLLRWILIHDIHWFITFCVYYKLLVYILCTVSE